MNFDFARKLILIARRLTQSELSGNDWAGRNRVPVGLVLTDGTLIYPGSAPAGGNPGEFLFVPSGKLLVPAEVSVLSPGSLVGEMIVSFSPIPQQALNFLGWPRGHFLKLSSCDVYVTAVEDMRSPGVFLALSEGRIGMLE